MKRFILAGLLGSVLPVLSLNAQDPKAVAPGTPVNIIVTPGQPAPPEVSFSLLKRTGHATPTKSKCTHTGGGNIDVQQPSPDTIVITMSAAAVAYGTPINPGSAGMSFDLTQAFEVSFDKPSVKAAKITIEGRVVGLLRSSCKGGCASESGAASISANGASLASMSMPGHTVSNGENLSVNDREGPVSTVITAAGEFTLSQIFSVQATMPRCGFTGKAPSVEFAPDPAIDPLWISAKEPFHGAAKKDFGFQVTVKVAPEEIKDKKEPEKVSPPKKLSQIRDLRPVTVDLNTSPYLLPRR